MSEKKATDSSRLRVIADWLQQDGTKNAAEFLRRLAGDLERAQPAGEARTGASVNLQRPNVEVLAEKAMSAEEPNYFTCATIALATYIEAIEALLHFVWPSEPDPETQNAGEAEPIGWYETEPSCRGISLEILLSGIGQMTHSARWHWQAERPETSNPVWPVYAAPPAAANQAGIPVGWKITPDEEGWGIVSPSGDGCYLFNLDSLHGKTMEGAAIREVLRQLCSSLVYPDTAAPAVQADWQPIETAPPAAANQAGIPEDAYEIFLRAYHLGKPLDEAFSQGLRAALSKTEIPNGWKLAPIEPTYTMKDAPKKDRPGFSRVVATEVWRAMLAAAPHAESHALGGGDEMAGNGEVA